MHTPLRGIQGITLIELLVVIIILSILAGMALPAFANIGQSIASRAARSELSVALAQARASAVMTRGEVVACPSLDQATCLAGTRWHHGWILFQDTNRNRSADPGERLIGVAQAQRKGVAILASAGRRTIRFQADGTSDGSNVTLTFCDRRGAAHARALVMNNAGRVRSGVPSASQAEAACAAIGS